MEWLERLKKHKPFLVCTWAVAGLLALGGIAGAINSLLDLYNRGGFEVAGNWYATATDWLSSEMLIPVWLGLLSTTLLIILAASAVIFLFKYFKTGSRDIALSAEERYVLWAIGACNNVHNYEPTMKDIAEPCGLTVSVAERAADTLHLGGMIEWHVSIRPSRPFQTPQTIVGASITSMGRNYLLDAGLDPSNPKPSIEAQIEFAKFYSVKQS